MIVSNNQIGFLGKWGAYDVTNEPSNCAASDKQMLTACD